MKDEEVNHTERCKEKGSRVSNGGATTDWGAERERVCRMRNVQVAGHVLGEDARVHGMGWTLSALLVVYAGEVLFVLVVVL